MKILRAELQGFRSFSDPQVIDFSKMKPGLYYIAGQNLVDPELESNAAGKSSLLEGMFWACFGKTSRNLRSWVVKNWNSDEKCAVIMDVQVAAGPMSILRVWKPNILEISGKTVGDRPVDQPELERLLGMTPEAFLFSIYFAQFSQAFVDLAPSEQTAVFSSVLDLELWERASDRANEHSREIEGQIQQLQAFVARIQGQAEELLSKDYTEVEKGWKNDYRAELRVAEGSLAQKQQTLKELDVEAKTYQKVEVAINTQTSVVSELTAELRHLSNEVEKLSAQNITKCPTCGQVVNRQHIKKELSRIQLLFDSKETELTIATKKLAFLRKQIPDDFELRHRNADREFQFAQAAMSAAKNRTNPYIKLREEQEERGEELAKQLDTAEGTLHTEEKHVKAVQYWVKGFKEIRLSLIHESLTQLTVEVNETLFQLGLQDWAVEFDIEHENKNKSINRSFTTMIHAPHVDRPVPWEAWCGGESQRLRLAISMGFSNLICNRTGVKPNTEFWDEPSQWLSETGIQDLLTVLANRAERQQKIILLADHRVLDFGGFAGTLMVTKDGNGSHVSAV